MKFYMVIFKDTTSDQEYFKVNIVTIRQPENPDE